METMQFVTAFLGLLFVLGLVLLTITLLKWLQGNGANFCWCKKMAKKDQIVVVEQRRLDAKNSISLIEVAGVRYLLLVGAENVLLLNQWEEGRHK